MRRIVIAGVSSGVGKTTIACGLMAAWRRRGTRVQPFKVGPDFIDPGYHARAAGRPSRNLDSVLLPPATLQALFARAEATADVSVIEGVMGLFDGRNDHGEEGSTAHIAKLVDAPVVVVIDVAKIGRTAAAIAVGCAHFDPHVRVAGFILNRVASPIHERIVRDAIEVATGLPVLGCVPRNDAFAVPERHLGLLPAGESPLSDETVDHLTTAAERHLDLERIWALTESGPVSTTAAERTVAPAARRATIALADDRAFNFYYEDSLDVLTAAGATLVRFSPLRDVALPPGVQGVYLGGGFPEVFAGELAENRSLLASIRQAAGAGLPIYGECGGLMYLGETLTDFEGVEHRMAGVLPQRSAMQRRRVTLGYRTAKAQRASILLEVGDQVMGHEFHYSELLAGPTDINAAYRLAERDNALEGYVANSVLASYVHLHFGTNPAMAARFVDRCAAVDR